jgi:hypothetical protein
MLGQNAYRTTHFRRHQVRSTRIEFPSIPFVLIYLSLSLSENREFLVGQAPQLVKATSTYCVEGRLKIEQNDTIAIIDGRPELTFLKGQNQRTFEIGTFPRNILEVLRFNRHGTLNTISRPVHGTLQHMAHGSTAGPSWGSPSYLDSSYSGGQQVQLRQKSADQVSKNNRQQKAVSEHYAKEKKVSASKQFSYNKLVNENRLQNEYTQMPSSLRSRPKPVRPPAPHVQPTEGILIDLSPEEIRSMTLGSHQVTTSGATGCLLDEPIDIPTEHQMMEEQQQLQRIPPPYPLPPQYSNNQPIHDPFDTTHIAPMESLYANSSVAFEPIYNNNQTYGNQQSSNDPLNELLSASLASLTIATTSNSSENINGQPVTPKRIEKQTLAEQMQGVKDTTNVRVNLEQVMNMQVPMTRTYDFAPTNGNYSTNIYNSVAGDPIYSESFYDAVHSQAPSVIYDSTASIYGVQRIYDEVNSGANSTYEEIGAWRPQTAALRPAPAPPGAGSASSSSSPMLSQQQINRRLEKINQQYGRVAELMNKLSIDNMSEEEAKEALEATNWNQDLATRHFKVERLSK